MITHYGPENNRNGRQLINSPYQHLGKCIENSMENMHIDVKA